MSQDSISAYDLPSRVATYDADMALMHPNRSKMVGIALETLPFEANSEFLALDIGVGTGFFTGRVLDRFPRCRILVVDGARAMIDLARTRLGALADRVEFRVGDFRQLAELIGKQRGRLAFSSYALHHLTRAEKTELVRQALDFLEPGGWFINADLVIAPTPEVERRIQEIRIDGILLRAAGRDPRFADRASTRAFLEDVEAGDHDKPLTLEEDLETQRRAGLRNASVFWSEFREAVTGGFKWIRLCRAGDFYETHSAMIERSSHEGNPHALRSDGSSRGQTRQGSFRN